MFKKKTLPTLKMYDKVIPDTKKRNVSLEMLDKKIYFSKF